KGIPHRLRAFALALERYPEIRRQVTFVQVVVPSRQRVTEYDKLKQEIERMVGEINGRYTEVGWIPIHYIFRSLNRSELIAYYKTCEIALITPLKDGMNLIAKEYCASNIEEKGVLILSEFAGAASQLYQHAVTVNPFDVQGTADAIHKAFTMDHDERQARMRKLRRLVQHYDIFFWVDTFLRTAIAKRLEDFPQMEMFVPTSVPYGHHAV
ncbi:MAG TPA: trehalose-6-phosphate synthase, partial [Deltaproteobacteria bacterium]|nr:trehalose-6-phosphate synthase [Deltaproteobacteria bacterium]